jgi:hypothetical protein
MIKYKFEYKLNQPIYKNVYIAGSFNNWKKNKMTYNVCDNVYYYNIILQEGIYEYKFFIDNEWIYNKKFPTIITKEGYINNYIVLTYNIYESNHLLTEYSINIYNL